MKKASQKNMIPMGEIPKEPPYKGEPFRIDSRTEVRQRANCKLSREVWEAKMLGKYRNYERLNEIARLTGAAKERVKG